MIFEIKTKEIILPNGENDGYETIEYAIADYIIVDWLLDIIEKHYGKGARRFAEDYDILDSCYSYYITNDFKDKLDERAQEYYVNEVK